MPPPAIRSVNSVRPAARSGLTRPYPGALLDAYGPQALTIRAEGNPQRGDARSHASNTYRTRADRERPAPAPPRSAPLRRYFFGVNVCVSVAQVLFRRALSHAAAFAVYISAYP
ncbi:hypothetical protein GCM10010251_14500 [Streptomyces aurantiogriseus]|uniref:Uncharacterized protein n=1 Tax=Streptomyces aurantiogriseus TaxID=66870 RepID=A0A918F343_9ACTN|nr:hypothetical protein GCM10010251_14500 [Streptomyces aurantiogriseus]